MLASEIQILKDLVDKELPALLQAEVVRLPIAWQAMAASLLPVFQPILVAALDSAIAGIPVNPAATA